MTLTWVRDGVEYKTTHIELERPSAREAKDLVWVRGGIEYKATRRWNEAEHPRDRVGKFIEIGGTVRLSAVAGGGTAVVRKNVGAGIFEVERTNGGRVTVHRRYLTVESRPDGGKPTDNPQTAKPAPVKPASDGVPDAVDLAEQRDVDLYGTPGLNPPGTGPAPGPKLAPEPYDFADDEQYPPPGFDDTPVNVNDAAEAAAGAYPPSGAAAPQPTHTGLYHATTNAEHLIANGFSADVIGGTNGAFFGRGVYFHTDPDAAAESLKGYQTYINPNMTQIRADAYVKNPFHLDATEADTSPINLMHDALVAAGLWEDTKNPPEPAEITEVLQAAGYDGVEVTQQGFNHDIGGSQLVVFNPAAITVAKPGDASGPEDGGPDDGLTQAQKVALAQGWKKLPTGTVAELQAQLAAVKVAPVPSALELIDGGMDPDKAAKEHKRLLRNAKVNEWRQRTKLQAALDGLVKQDTGAGPSKLSGVVKDTKVGAADVDPVADEAAADIALGPAGKDLKPVALYDPPKKGGKYGPGGDPALSWFARMAAMTDEDDPIPVVGLTVQGRRVEHGWAVKRGTRAYLVERRAGETPAQALERLEKMRTVVEGVMAPVPAHLQGAMTGVALLDGPNPQDGYWAKEYNTPGFKSNATAGDGSITAWNGTVPKPATVAHEFGHNVDASQWQATEWMSQAKVPILGQVRSWGAAVGGDSLTSAGWAGRFKETRVGDHLIQLGEMSVSKYGENSVREDFAESVRLYLKDKREGKVGYDPTTGDNLRFADLFPHRAEALAAVFGDTLDEDTPARKRRRQEAEDAYVKQLEAAEVDNAEGIDPDSLFGSAWQDQPKYGLSKAQVEVARVAALKRYGEQQAAAKAAAKAAADALAKAQAEAVAAQKAADASQYETVKAALDAGLFDKGTADKLRARRRAAKFHAKKKGLSEADAEAAAVAYERAMVQKWIAENAAGKAPVEPWKTAEMLPGVQQNQNLKADEYVTGAGKVVHPLAQEQTAASWESKEAKQAKANIAAALGHRLDNPADWAAFRAYKLASADHDVGPYDKPSGGLTRQEWLDAQASEFVQKWAETSGDSSPDPVRMQIAIGQEFGISAHPAPRMNATEYADLVAGTKPEQLAFMRRFARVQYEHTQEQLKAAGIEFVSVYRGMNFGMDRPAWAKTGKHRPKFQPANSWSSKLATSSVFGSTMFRATIPAALVLGSARTGFGCLNESEYVILDANGFADVTAPIGS